jgi:translation initiation factor 1A
MSSKTKTGGKVKFLKAGSKIKKEDLQIKDDGQAYGKAVKMYGGGRIEVECFDGVSRSGHIRGSFRSGKISLGDIVLVSLRDYQDSKCDILLRYSPEDKRYLQSINEIPNDNDIDHKDVNETEEGFTFEDI